MSHENNMYSIVQEASTSEIRRQTAINPIISFNDAQHFLSTQYLSGLEHELQSHLHDTFINTAMDRARNCESSKAISR